MKIGIYDIESEPPVRNTRVASRRVEDVTQDKQPEAKIDAVGSKAYLDGVSERAEINQPTDIEPLYRGLTTSTTELAKLLVGDEQREEDVFDKLRNIYNENNERTI